MDGPRKSLTGVYGGHVRSFPTYDDLVRHLLDVGKISSPDELIGEKRGLLGAILFQWIRSGQLACRFARRLAKRRAEVAWPTLIVSPGRDVEHIGPFLDDAETHAEAVSIIFVGATTAQDACAIVSQLCTDPRWWWEEIPWEDDPPARQLLVGLRWNARRNDHTSWVLGFGPFDSMPFTRQVEGAPFIALAFRPTPPSGLAPPMFDRGRAVAHLADMPDLLETEAQRTEFRRNTEDDKRAFVGENFLKSARARVTFRVPFECRELLPPPRASIET